MCNTSILMMLFHYYSFHVLCINGKKKVNSLQVIIKYSVEWKIT